MAMYACWKALHSSCGGGRLAEATASSSDAGGASPGAPASPLAPALMNSGLNSVSVAPTTAASRREPAPPLPPPLSDLALRSRISRSRSPDLDVPLARRRAIFLRVDSSFHSTAISVMTTTKKYRIARITTASTTDVTASRYCAALPPMPP
jgi:hypothetical protein